MGGRQHPHRFGVKVNDIDGGCKMLRFYITVVVKQNINLFMCNKRLDPQ